MDILIVVETEPENCMILNKMWTESLRSVLNSGRPRLHVIMFTRNLNRGNPELLLSALPFLKSKIVGKIDIARSEKS